MKILKIIVLYIILSHSFINCASTKSDSTKDGSSIENAIKVKSVDEEYQIVRKLCIDCQLSGQSLVSKSNKHFDVINMIKPNGDKISYYFDINSFYGKW